VLTQSFWINPAWKWCLDNKDKWRSI